MLINKIFSPGEVQSHMAEKFKRARLDQGHSRSKAAKLTGVPESTLRAFETKGQISLRQFVMLCHVYGDLLVFEDIFSEKTPQTMEQLLVADKKPKRQRGRS